MWCSRCHLWPLSGSLPVPVHPLTSRVVCALGEIRKYFQGTISVEKMIVEWQTHGECDVPRPSACKFWIICSFYIICAVELFYKRKSKWINWRPYLEKDVKYHQCCQVENWPCAADVPLLCLLFQGTDLSIDAFRRVSDQIHCSLQCSLCFLTYFSAVFSTWCWQDTQLTTPSKIHAHHQIVGS